MCLLGKFFSVDGTVIAPLTKGKKQFFLGTYGLCGPHKNAFYGRFMSTEAPVASSGVRMSMAKPVFLAAIISIGKSSGRGI